MIDTSKVIHAPVGGGRYTVTAPIVKEDYGLYLKIEGLELPSTYEVDFSNDEHSGSSVTMIGNADGVLIPSQFISSGKDIFAFLYHVGADYGRTIYKFRIPNKLRPDRTDEEPTPEEQSTIDQAISALNSAVTATAQDVIDADASAQSASESAEQAQESARTAGLYSDTAQTYANSAEISANNASASATASAQSAEASARCSADAQDSAEEAQGYANSASQSATASANSASQASASATSASQSATSASGYATSAQSSAQTASTKASEASTSAQTASTKASEASQSATTASNKASEASGYATSASQAKTDAESARDTAQGYAEDAQGYAEDAQASAESVSASASQIAQNTSDIASLEADIYKPYATDTASGAIASFLDGADDIPLKSLIVDINPVQDLSQGDPSPENICPISGWDGVNVRRCNENLWDDAWYSLGNAMTKVVDETSDFYGYYWGAVKTWANAQQSNGFTKLFPYGVDRLTVTAEMGNISTSSAFTFRIIFYYSDGTSEYDHNIVVASRSKKTETRASLSGKKCIGFVISTSASTGNPNGAVRRIMVSVDGTTDFIEPVQNPLIPISWQTEAGTVYGGKLDVLSGVMRADIAMVTFDGSSDENWSYYSIVTGNLFQTALNDRKQGEINASIPDIESYKCNAYKVAVNSLGRINGTFSGSLKNVDFVNNEYSTLAEWRQYLSENNVQFVYPLAEPIEIQLTPHEVNSLLGVNNIWADTGDTEVEYRADTKLYISRLTEPDADMIADANIVSGQYFMVGNNLYKATANIASGGQVIVGTNAIRKSLSEALNEINA